MQRRWHRKEHRPPFPEPGPEGQTDETVADHLGGEQDAIRTRELFGFDDGRKERLGRTVEDHLTASDYQQENEEQSDSECSRGSGDRDHCEKSGPQRVGADHEESSVEAVDVDADR